jgi:hypothetical protein
MAQHRSRRVGAGAGDAGLGDDAAAAAFGPHKNAIAAFAYPGSMNERNSSRVRTAGSLPAKRQKRPTAPRRSRNRTLSQRNEALRELIEQRRRVARQNGPPSHEQAEQRADRF